MSKSKSSTKPSVENIIENEMDVHRLGIRGLKWFKRIKDSFAIIQSELKYTRENIIRTKNYKSRIKQYRYIRLLKRHAKYIYSFLIGGFYSNIILGILSDLATKYHIEYAKKYVLFAFPHQKPISWQKIFKPVIKKNTFNHISKFYYFRIKHNCGGLLFHNDAMRIAKEMESILNALASDYHILKY